MFLQCRLMKVQILDLDHSFDTFLIDSNAVFIDRPFRCMDFCKCFGWMWICEVEGFSPKAASRLETTLFPVAVSIVCHIYQVIELRWIKRCQQQLGLVWLSRTGNWMVLQSPSESDDLITTNTDGEPLSSYTSYLINKSAHTVDLGTLQINLFTKCTTALGEESDDLDLTMQWALEVLD
jgi:hypothetical protein